MTNPNTKKKITLDKDKINIESVGSDHSFMDNNWIDASKSYFCVRWIFPIFKINFFDS
jgi:hypothetical protein